MEAQQNERERKPIAELKETTVKEARHRYEYIERLVDGCEWVLRQLVLGLELVCWMLYVKEKAAEHECSAAFLTNSAALVNCC